MLDPRQGCGRNQRLSGHHQFRRPSTRIWQSSRKTKKFLESVIANSYDGIYLTDRNGLTLAVNQSYERITGIERRSAHRKIHEEPRGPGVLSDYITDDVVAQK